MIAKPMPFDSTGSRYRNKSTPANYLSKRNKALSLDQLVREGKACAVAIAKAKASTLDTSRISFRGHLDQATRLWMAAEGGIMENGKPIILKGPKFSAFAKSIKIGRTIAYRMVKLHPRRRQITAWGKDIASGGHWPGLKSILATFGGSDHSSPERTTSQASDRSLQPSRYGEPFRNGTPERPTPQYVFDHQHAIHNFDLDVCATPDSAKTSRYYTKTQDALKQFWLCTCAWMNPPYAQIEAFLKKAFQELQAGRCKKVVALLPGWTDTPWFGKYASHGQISFLIGRLKFGGASGTAFFPSMIVVLTDISVRRGRKLSAEILTIPKPQSQPAERLENAF
jgi:phage N-6-adenine-methyltransferase